MPICFCTIGCQHSTFNRLFGCVFLVWRHHLREVNKSSVRTFRRFFLQFCYLLMFLNIQIDWIILKTYDQQFTLTTKKSLHIIFKSTLKWWWCLKVPKSPLKVLKFSCCMSQNLIIYFLCITYTTGLIWFDTMAKSSCQCKLCVKALLLLSHGQASVERGFSVNKQVEIDNLTEDTRRC